MSVAVALLAGALIGLSLGTLGAGGSILAVPVLVLGLGQSPLQATTGSLVVVGTTALLGALDVARRTGSVRWARGAGFGLVAVGGAAGGARLATGLPDAVLLTAFAGLLVVVAALMLVRRTRAATPGSSEPILTLRPAFACACPRALRVLVTASAIGFLTGLLGVGGGFLVVPALVLALGLSLREATGTSLVVIAVTTTAAFLFRLGAPTQPDWGLVVLLTLAAVGGALAGTRLAPRVPAQALQSAFATVLVLVAGVTAWHSVPGLVQ
jgi:uncharacterized membrane protein YfcA